MYCLECCLSFTVSPPDLGINSDKVRTATGTSHYCYYYKDVLPILLMTWMLSRDKNLVVVLCPNEPNEPTTRMSNEDTGARGPDRADSRIFMAVNESVTRRRQCCEWEEQEDDDDVGEKDIIIIISCFPPPQLLYWYGVGDVCCLWDQHLEAHGSRLLFEPLYYIVGLICFLSSGSD